MRGGTRVASFFFFCAVEAGDEGRKQRLGWAAAPRPWSFHHLLVTGRFRETHRGWTLTPKPGLGEWTRTLSSHDAPRATSAESHDRDGGGRPLG